MALDPAVATVPQWAKDMSDPAKINAIMAALPFGAVAVVPKPPAATPKLTVALKAGGAATEYEATIADPPAGAKMLTIDWGDGNTDPNTPIPVVTKPSHTYAAGAGPMTVTATFDVAGTASTQVTVP